jgi:hypothetical protein
MVELSWPKECLSLGDLTPSQNETALKGQKLLDSSQVRVRTIKRMIIGRTLRFALLASLCLHIALAFILSRRYQPLPDEVQPVELVFPNAPAKASTGHGKKISKRWSPPFRGNPLSQFLPQLAMKPMLQKQESDDEPITPAWANARTYTGIDPTGEYEISREQANFLISLWRIIDQAIWDSDFLSEYNHVGQVFMRFEVDDEGHFESRSMTASAPDRILKVIAARAIRTAMKNETGDVHFPHHKTVINARFVWSGYEECGGMNPIRKNFLNFCHHAENKVKTFSKGEKAATYAGAIWNHGPWAIEDINEYNHEQRRRQSEFDPFESMKRDPDWNL